MNYISTRELAESWNISISRIVRLAKAGRIPGAKLIGKSWLFPAEAQKPADMRRKNRNDAQGADFHFPLYFYTSYSEEEIRSQFSEDETALYDAELLFHRGDFSGSTDRLKEILLHTQNRYVRFGALYYLCNAAIELHNYFHALQYYHKINQMFSEEKNYSHELEFLIHDLETSFTGNNYYLNKFNIDPQHIYPPSMHGYLLLQSAYADILKCLVHRFPVNAAPYQLICQHDLVNLGVITEILLPLYTALLLRENQMVEESRGYLLRSCISAEEKHMEGAIAYILQYCPAFFAETLKEKHPQLLDHLTGLSAQSNEAFHGLLKYLEKSELFQLLDPIDYQFIIYAGNGATHKEIASAMHLSIASISKKYAALYEKTGAHNKAELAQICSRVIKDYSPDPSYGNLE